MTPNITTSLQIPLQPGNIRNNNVNNQTATGSNNTINMNNAAAMINKNHNTGVVQVQQQQQQQQQQHGVMNMGGGINLPSAPTIQSTIRATIQPHNMQSTIRSTQFSWWTAHIMRSTNIHFADDFSGDTRGNCDNFMGTPVSCLHRW